MIIAIDFDGTVVKHEYPMIGEELPNCVSVLKKMVEAGHQLILHTMRGEVYETQSPYNNPLLAAVKWFEERGIPLYGINTNPTQKDWTNSPKTYAHLYIDDAALGIPLIHGKHSRPYVDWHKVEEMLFDKKIANHTIEKIKLPQA